MDLTTYTIEGPSYFKWLFYLQVMLFGGFLASGGIRIPKGRIVHLLALLTTLALYFAVLMAVRAGFGKVQALVHVLTFFIVYLVLTLSRSAFTKRVMFGSKLGTYLVSLMAGLTLEIYLLQFMVYSNHLINSLLFPLNMLVFWITVVLLALVVANVAGLIRRLLRQEKPIVAITV